mgnify:FL=1
MNHLTKSRDNQVISGVCAGIAEYVNIDPTIVRLLWIFMSMAAGGGVLAYIICAAVMPEREY